MNKQSKMDFINEIQKSESISRKLDSFKKENGILTHRSSSEIDWPWLAILVQEEDKKKDIGLIMAESCRYYDESGFAITGKGELSVVRELCETNGIPLFL